MKFESHWPMGSGGVSSGELKIMGKGGRGGGGGGRGDTETKTVCQPVSNEVTTKMQLSTPGLEKLTNANRSVSSVNDRLFPVELTEIADWKSMSEYMLHSNFRKALTGVIGGNFGANTFILPLPCLLNICLSFWVFYRRKEYLNKINIHRNFRE